MASLDELKKRLYRNAESFKERMSEPDLTREPLHRIATWEQSSMRQTNATTKKYRWWIIAGFAVVALVGIGVFLLVAPSSFFQTQAVNFEIQGNPQLKSGDRNSWDVVIINQNKNPIHNVSLIFTYPDGAQSVTESRPTGNEREKRVLGTLLSGASITETFNAFVFGGRGEARVATAVLEYSPEGSNSVFAKTFSFPFTIVRSPVSLSFELPHELRVDQQLALPVHYISQSQDTLRNLILEIVLPSDFEFSSANPNQKDPIKKGVLRWTIDSLSAGEEGKVVIQGIVHGKELDSKSFQATIGIANPSSSNGALLAYDSLLEAATLRAPLLDVALRVGRDDVIFVSPGDVISVDVLWRNNLPQEVRNAKIEARPIGILADLTSIESEHGSYLQSAQSIVWDSRSYSPFQNIASGQSGSFRFTFRLKKDLLSSNSLPQSMKWEAIFGSNTPIPGFEGVDVRGLSALEVKVRSHAQLVARGLYFNAPLINSGPLPPQVGHETTYAVIWSVTNSFNDLENTTVSAVLPPYITFKNNISPQSTDIQFDSNTGNVTWYIGKLSAGTGFSSPAIEVAFQIGIIPAPNQAGEAPDLVSGSELSGQDAFTEETIRAIAKRISTSLRDDLEVTPLHRIVIP